MWNRTWLLKIKIKSKKTRIVIPVPLFIFSQLLDCTMDLLAIIAFFTPRTNIAIKNSKYNLKEIIRTIYKILESLKEIKYCKPFDFVDIQTKEDIVKISLK
ncbi:hypothetical protein [Vallitalea sp.]|jgi:hypothetical protein|uniref:hypothetical protein n=1 Tax=Vallitalea sp. TaxID=1882829 RepID=UPI0025F2FB31|nr:hypothetical protein [Vallitalea sp.]MCT4688638.1 hypothetical protein [Vallitalea sp.]